jgi:hypothetical protein
MLKLAHGYYHVTTTTYVTQHQTLKLEDMMLWKPTDLSVSHLKERLVEGSHDHACVLKNVGRM